MIENYKWIRYTCMLLRAPTKLTVTNVYQPDLRTLQRMDLVVNVQIQSNQNLFTASAASASACRQLDLKAVYPRS